MLKKILFFIIFTYLFSSLAYSAQDVSALLMRLEKKMSGIKSLETDFSQEKKLAVFNKALHIKGKIFIQKPDYFAWYTREPVRYGLVINRDFMRQWDEDTQKIQQLSLLENPIVSAAILQMRAWFQGQYSSLEKDYTISLISEDPVVLEFKPFKNNPSSSVIENIRVTFARDERYLESIRIEEKSRDTTVINFSSTKLNTPIQASVWELKLYAQ